MSQAFRVGLTRDFLKPDGTMSMPDIGLSMLDEADGVEWEFLAKDEQELSVENVRDYDALIVLAPRVTAPMLEGTEKLAIVARFGVGYDTVDVDACTANGVLLTITPDGVRRSLALSAFTFLLALSHELMAKDRLTREGRWDDRQDYYGVGLVGRTLGIVGLGNIGSELCRLAQPFGLRVIAADPYAKAEHAAGLGVELVNLETLLKTSDFVSITSALTPETRGLIGPPQLALMKGSAFLINVARGPIVDQKALTETLRERRIRGAAIDVFEQEPVDPADPILKLDNITVAPHAICWTDEGFLLTGQSAIRSTLAVAAGKVPENVVNGAVIDAPSLQEKLRRYPA